MNEELEKLYKVLFDEGLYSKSYDEFLTQWKDDAYKSKVFGVVTNEGLYSKDETSFYQKYSLKKKEQAGLPSTEEKTVYTESKLPSQPASEPYPSFLGRTQVSLSPEILPPPVDGKPQAQPLVLDASAKRQIQENQRREVQRKMDEEIRLEKSKENTIAEIISDNLDLGFTNLANSLAQISTVFSGPTLPAGISVPEEYKQKPLTAEERDALSARITEKAKSDIAEMQKTSRQFDQGFIEYLSEGNFEDAFKLGLATTMQSAPYMLSSIVLPTGGALATIGAVSSGQAYNELSGEDWFEELSPAAKAGFLGAYGGFEAGGEYFGTRVIKRAGKMFLKGLITDEALERTTKEFLKGAAKAYGVQMGEEALGEAVTGFGQSITQQAAEKGIDNVNWQEVLDQTLEGAALGAFGAGLITTPAVGVDAVRLASSTGKGTEKIVRKNNIEKLKNEYEAAENVQTKQIVGEQLDKAVKEDAIQTKNDVQFYKEIGKQSPEDLKELNRLDIEIRAKINQLTAVPEGDVKDAGKVQLRDLIMAKQEIENKYDRKEEVGVPSGVQEGEAVVAAEPVVREGEKTPEADRVLQAQEALILEALGSDETLAAVEAGQEIDQADVEAVQQKILNLIDSVSKSEMAEESKAIYIQTLEDKFDELEYYDNKTITTAEQVTERVPVGPAKPVIKEQIGAEVRRGKLKIYERLENVEVATGKETDTQTSVVEVQDDGSVDVVTYDKENKQEVSRDKRVADSILGLEYVESITDSNGNVTGVVMRPVTAKGEAESELRIEIKNRPDLSLDLAIEARKRQIGYVPNVEFEQAYEEVTKTVERKEKAPVKERQVAKPKAVEKPVAEKAASPVTEEVVQPRVERGIIQESIKKADRVLNKLIPEAGVKIITHNTKAEFDAAMDEVSKRGSTKDRTEYGRFIPSRNEIHINFENSDAEGPLHEAFHAVFVYKYGRMSQEKREATAKEFEAGLKKVLNSGSAVDIDIAKEMDRFVKDGGYTVEESPEEFLAQLAGFMGANYTQLSKPTQNKLIQWINSFIGKFFPSLKIKSSGEFVDFMNSFASAANEQVETNEESRPLTPSPIEISPESFPEKSSKGAFNTEGTYLANEPKVNIKDLFSTFKAENNRNPNVWIWMSDQLKRGQYVNPETGVTLNLEGGIGFAFDPKNREQNVVWSSGLSQKTLQDRIGKSDFIWFMSGSPLTSFNFSKGTTKAIIAEIEAGLEKFKGKSLEGVRIKDASFEEFIKIADKFLSEEKYKNVKKWEGINSALTKYKSGIIDHPSRMKVAENLLHEGAGKKMQIPIQQFLHQTLGVPTKDVFHSLLRDEALIKNNIANGDLTLLVKPTGIIDNAGLHDTYPHAITGDVIGMPEQIYNVLDVVPEDAKKVISKETGLPLEKPSAPAQIKTAVGDVGRIYEGQELATQKAYGDLVKESSSKQFIEGQQQSQIDAKVDDTVGKTKEWKERERTSFERFVDLIRLKIQDKNRDIIRMQENVELATEKPVGLDQDFRNAETLMYGKAANDLQNTEEKVRIIASLIKDSGLSIEEFNDLLYALHAQERNRYIRIASTDIGEAVANLRKELDMSPKEVAELLDIPVEDYKKIEDGTIEKGVTAEELSNILNLYGVSQYDFFYENALVKDGSGMTDQEAQEILSKYGIKNLVDPSVSELPEKVSKAVKAVHDLIANTRETMLDFGLESLDTIYVFETTYKNYVPLQGFADENSEIYAPEILEGGRKLEVRGRLKQAKGRGTKADSPLTQAIMQNTNTIIRARKNEVMQSLYNLAKNNPNKDVWQTIDPQSDQQYKLDKKNGKISKVAKTISDYMSDPSIVAVRIDGEYKFIQFVDPRMAETLRGATVVNSDFIVKFLGGFNRLLSSFITTYDPEFVLRNFSRDIQTAVFNAYSEQQLDDGIIKGEEIVGKIIKSVPKSVKTIYALEKGKESGGDAEFDQYYKEFLEDGAKTAWFYSKGTEELSKDIQGYLDGKKDSPLKLASNLVERVNTSVENGVRFAAYVQSRKAGIERAKAAEFAKNLTVNFNKSGEWGTVANSLYLFFNASVQGTSRLIRTLKPQFKKNDDGTRSLQVTTAQKLAIGMAIAGALMSMLNEALSDDDEDGKSFYSKIPDFEKERNIIIMKPNGKGYFKIPLPYGINVFYVFGGSMADAGQGIQKPAEAITNVLQAAVGSFSPINFPNSDDASKWITKLLMPTIGQIPVSLALNEDYFGRSIYNTNFPFDKTPKPQSELGRGDQGWAKWLNKATGGSEFRSGFIDINPDKTDFILETLSGGAGRFVMRSAKVITSVASGNWDKLEPNDIPFVRVFYGQPSKYTNLNDYYKKNILVNQMAEEAKAGIISGKERANVLKMQAVNKSVASNLRKYKKLEDAAMNIKDAEKKDARMLQLEKMRYAEIARFQKLYEKLNIDDIK